MDKKIGPEGCIYREWYPHDGGSIYRCELTGRDCKEPYLEWFAPSKCEEWNQEKEEWCEG